MTTSTLDEVLPKIEWVKRIPEGGYLPDGYGIAWRDWDRHGAACMPIPLNVIAGWGRRLWIELRHGLRVGVDRQARELFAAEQRGYARGYHLGRRHEAADSAREISAAFERGREHGWNEALEDIRKDFEARVEARRRGEPI